MIRSWQSWPTMEAMMLEMLDMLEREAVAFMNDCTRDALDNPDAQAELDLAAKAAGEALRHIQAARERETRRSVVAEAKA